MYQLSDSDSKDSDHGIRFKTESTRNKSGSTAARRRSRSRSPRRRRSRSKSSKRQERSSNHRRDRSKSRRSRDRAYKSRRMDGVSRKDRGRDRKKNESDETVVKHVVRSTENARADTGPLGHADQETTDEITRKEIDRKDIEFKEQSHIDNKPFRMGSESPSPIAKNQECKEVVEENIMKTTGNPKKVIGPVLPPHLTKMQTEMDLVEESVVNSDSLSQDLSNGRNDNSNNETKKPCEESVRSDTSGVIGPALPPHMIKGGKDGGCSEQVKVLGPSLPPHLKTIDNGSGSEKYSIGPTFPSDLPQTNECSIAPLLNNDSSVVEKEEPEEEEDLYGPLLPGQAAKSRSHVALEERALEMKLGHHKTDGEKLPEREEWMTELPEVKASKLGLGPRQFRAKAGPDMSDRSSWTDTPNKKKNKTQEVDLKKDTERKELERRDRQQEKMSKKHKKQKESLLEMHQKKKKTDTSGPSERRPFSREIDLKVNRFDEAQKKAVLKKAQLLDDRFSRGQSKFL